MENRDRIVEHMLKSVRMDSFPKEINDKLEKASDIEDFRRILRENKSMLPPHWDSFADFDIKKNREFIKENLVKFMDKLNVGIWVIDAKEDYVYANRALLEMSGTPAPENILGCYCKGKATDFDILIPDIIKETNEPLTAYQDVENKLNGRHYRQLITQTPILNEKNEVEFIVAVVESLEHLNGRLREAQNNHLKYVINKSQNSRNVNLIAESPHMVEIVKTLKQISAVDVPILLEGESGTGKEVIANEIHKSGKRSKGPLIAVNCSAIPETLFESELFGYEKGSFTGAGSNGKEGLLEQANGGTLFLDEINSMPLAMQGKLLRVLETKSFRRVGGTSDIKSDFRIISATNQDLLSLCAQKQFREDLFYRLNIIPIRIPPLRNRKEDIIPLIEHFLSEFSTLYETNKTFSKDALKEMEEYPWPGNIRELKNFVERAVITTGTETVEIREIKELIAGNYEGHFNNQRESGSPEVYEGFDLKDYMENCEKEAVRAALEQSRTTYDAAKLLNISQSSVVKKKQKYGL